MSTITAPPAPAEAPRDPAQSAMLVDTRAYTDARQSVVAKTAVTTVLLVVASLADVFLAIPAFNGVLGASTFFSFVCGVAFVAIAVGAAVTAGSELKRGNRLTTYAASGAVLLLITGLLVLRITAAGINESAVAFEGATQEGDAALAELPVAIVFATLMLATSIFALIDGYLLTPDPRVRSLRVLDATEHRLAAESASLEAEEARLEENIAIAEERITRLAADEQDALAGLEAFARELQELARVEIARHLGAPTATSGLDTPSTHPATITPRNPDNA